MKCTSNIMPTHSRIASYGSAGGEDSGERKLATHTCSERNIRSSCRSGRSQSHDRGGRGGHLTVTMVGGREGACNGWSLG